MLCNDYHGLMPEHYLTKKIPDQLSSNFPFTPLPKTKQNKTNLN